MLSSQFAIYPDCGGVEYGFKFDSYRGVLPFTGSVERTLIPGDAAILATKSGSTCRSVRHPALCARHWCRHRFRTNASFRQRCRISSETASARLASLSPSRTNLFWFHALRAGGLTVLVTRTPALVRKFSTRMHGELSCPIR